MKVSLPYGDSIFDLDLAEGVREEGVIFPPRFPDPKKELRAVLQSPVSSSTLKEILPADGRISILISDITRAGSTSNILLGLLEYLQALGAGPDRVEVFLSMGVHRGHTGKELERHLGKEIMTRYKVHEHNAMDYDSMIDVGTTPAGTRCFFNERVVASRLVIGIGAISFHYFAGFGGSRKLVLPGIAAEKTIIANHRLSLLENPGEGLAEGCRPGNLDGNPVHEDMMAGAGLLPVPIFIINTVFDHDGNLVFVNSGDMNRSHQEAAAWYMNNFSFEIDRLYRVVVASPGGSPWDINLLQSHKAIRYASLAVDDGGLLLMAAACPEGIGSESYKAAFSRGRKNIPDMVNDKYTLNSQTAMSTYDVTGRIAVYIRSMIGDDELSRFGFCSWEEDYTRYFLEGTDPSDVLVIQNAASFLPVSTS